MRGSLRQLLTKEVRTRSKEAMGNQRSQRQREARLQKSSQKEPGGLPGPPEASQFALPSCQASFTTHTQFSVVSATTSN